MTEKRRLAEAGFYAEQQQCFAGSDTSDPVQSLVFQSLNGGNFIPWIFQIASRIPSEVFQSGVRITHNFHNGHLLLPAVSGFPALPRRDAAQWKNLRHTPCGADP